MNPFNLTYYERLNYIRNLREKISKTEGTNFKEIEKSFLNCFDFLKSCPKVKISMIKENTDTWPTIWELLKDNDYDDFSIIYIIAELHIQAIPQLEDRLEILTMKDLKNSKIIDILHYKGKDENVFLTHEGKIIRESEICKMSELYRFAKIKGKWKILEK